MSTTLPLDAETSEKPQPRTGGAPLYAKILKPLASLQLTVALFTLSVLLVFFGTLAQMNSGIWTVVSNYFWSYWVKVDFQILVMFFQKFDIFGIIPPTAKVSGWFPFIGGKLLGFLLLTNLLAAHLVRFKLTWKRSGVIILHSGMILLFVGEFITREAAVEQRMTIDEGGTANYAYDHRNFELAFVDRSSPTDDHVVVVPQSFLKVGERVSHADLPVDVEAKVSWVNSGLGRPAPNVPNLATKGLGLKYQATEKEEVSGVATQQVIDVPAMYVTLYRKGTNDDLGTYLVSPFLEFRDETETVTIDDKPYDMSLRFKRYYKPFTLELVNFSFDRYIGTSTAKNFSSDILLTDPERNVEKRPIHIAMNEPFRYRGETFYQQGFDEETEKTTILQVVRNPGWILPYFACAIVALGMLIHFGITLTKFVTRGRTNRAEGAAATAGVSLAALLFGKTGIFRVSLLSRLKNIEPQTGFQRALPWICLAFAGLYLLSKTMAPSTGEMDLNAAGQLPVIDGGRVKPLDSAARVRLRMITTKEEYTDAKGDTQPAIRWYFETATDPDPRRDPGPAAKLPLFRIENDQVLDLLGLQPRKGLRYSLEEIRKRAEKYDDAVARAKARPEKERDLFDAKLLDLQRQLETFMEVLFGINPRILPPNGDLDWRSPAGEQKAVVQEMAMMLDQEFPGLKEPSKLPKDLQDIYRRAARKAFDAAAANHPGFSEWQEILDAYRAKDAKEFNKLVKAYREKQYPKLTSWDSARVQMESFLNVFAPFYHSIALYVIAFVLTAIGWSVLSFNPALGDSLRRSAFMVLLLTFVVHSVALLSRMYLMDRPLVFVTNLYSSAVFIGAGVVGMCLIIERLFPIGLGNAVAAALGAGTCIIAHNLSASGDTLEMMQAVLDTNFWLATHVTTVTLGYAATYVAGAIGIGYVATGLFSKALDSNIDLGGRPQTIGKLIGSIMYGVICFATLLSFVGTVLGGIWADQSWGRFWGWDPKENGAVLIVTWNALILHARWCGLVKDRGVAVLALVGNMITTWSWFGTNQLGIGLHAYGFNKTLKDGCTIVWLAHLVLIAVALLPKQFWKSTGTPPRKV